MCPIFILDLLMILRDNRLAQRLRPLRHTADPLLRQQNNKVLHDVLALLNAIGVLPDGDLLGSALEPEEVLNVQLCRLLEAGPVRVLRVDVVHAVLVNLNSILEALVPGLDAEGPGSQILQQYMFIFLIFLLLFEGSLNPIPVEEWIPPPPLYVKK